MESQLQTGLVQQNVNTRVHPLVIINIPTYNQEKYIGRAIKSALAQDYPNLQVIVSDDCSSDNTYQVAKAFESDKVKILQTPYNMGRVAHYRHILYHLAHGDWVANLDGDDYYCDQTFVSEAVRLLRQYPSSVMYVGGAMEQDERTQKIVPAPIYLKKEITLFKGTEYVLNFYKSGQIGQHFSILYNRALALETNFYVLDSLGADTDSICRLALKGDVIVQKKWVGVWTSHASNASYTLNTASVEKELKMLEHIATAMKAYLPESTVDHWLKECQQLKFRQALYATLPALQFSRAIPALLKAWSWQLQDVKELLKLFLRLIKK